MKLFNKALGIASMLCIPAMFTMAQQWQMQKATLMTPFAAKVDTANVLGEYPRPQMVREKWMNLNGIWQFQPGTDFSQIPPAGKLPQKILVPFGVESAISGIMKHYDNILYRRTFTIPADWTGQRVLIHFGAVDYKSQIYINGQTVGVHTGGYDPFTYDITSKLTASGPQEITVKVNDPTNNGGQPRGKQTLAPGDITYTPTTGIWQSVWLEPVPQTSISDIKIVPDLDKSTVIINTATSGTASNLNVKVEIKDGVNSVAQFEGDANSDLRIPISNPKLWSPNSPFLYDVKITLKENGTPIDSLGSYFGMRKISLKQIGGIQKLQLNNETLFQFGPLDQGFWPDGIYTAPTDSAMLYDIQKTKDFGYNMIRKHIKVEPYRWYYYADKLGLLVWQDMPSSNSYTNSPQPIDKNQFKLELERMVKTHWNSPSIIMWVVFNEEQGEHDTEALVADVISLDSTRMVNENSGAIFKDVGHIRDLHSYPQPGCPASTFQALACGEYGSLGLNVAGHAWANGVSMVMKNTGDELLATYKEYADMLAKFKAQNGLSAAVFTQITDVERELNGILTYDRVVCKVNEAKLLEINTNVINKTMVINNVLPTSVTFGQTWKYTTSQPSSTWYTSTFNDAAWKSAMGGFGSSGTPGGNIRTSWTTNDIWMRQTFMVGNLTQTDIDNLELYVHHDENCEIYINGILAGSFSGYTSTYNFLAVNAAAKNALKANSSNVIAIHCHQTGGGQYIDAGLLIRSYEEMPKTALINISADGKCKVFPNPATNKLSVSRENTRTVLTGIYNSLGREVLKPNKFDSQVDISSLKPGVYFLKTETDKFVQNITFVKI